MTSWRTTFTTVAPRVLPVALVLTLCLVAFGAGVDLSERPGTSTAPLATRVYYSLGLFLLGGLDVGVPTGGPEWARTLLWGGYFLAPFITTTAVAEGLIRLANPRWLRRRPPRDHLLIVGLGQLGERYTEAVRRADPERRLLTVDLDPPAAVAERLGGSGIPVVRADIRHLPQWLDLGLDHAHGVLLATGDDLVNLGAAFELAQLHPGLVVGAHVADLGLRHSAEPLATRARVLLLNTHEMTAAHVFDTELAAHLRHTEARDVVVVAGFGRFGQTLLQHVHRRAPGEVQHVVIVDREATRRARSFAEQVGFDPESTWAALDGELTDPAMWDRVAEELAPFDVVPVVVLATHEDAANVQMAVGLRQRLATARLFVRCFADSSFLKDLEERYQLEALTLDGVLATALRAHYVDCFGTVGTRRNWWS